METTTTHTDAKGVQFRLQHTSTVGDTTYASGHLFNAKTGTWGGRLVTRLLSDLTAV